LEGVREQTGAQRYSAELGLRGTQDTNRSQRYGADRQLEGTRDTNRAQLEGVREQTRGQRAIARIETGSQERQIGLKGREDRATLVQGTDEQMRLRADARGAIRSSGRRWFG
jgi:hypothetical protein